MAAHNTFRSIAYRLTTEPDPWVVRCVMLLYYARMLTGQSGYLINPIVRMVQKRRRIEKQSINEARKILQANHTANIAMLLNSEGRV